MYDAEFLEKVRNFGEVRYEFDNCKNEFIQWIMRIGEARNILNNALCEFEITKKVMEELEERIPQFHKQPGLFKELSERINSLTSTLKHVNRALSCIKNKEESNICEDDREESDRDYEDEDTY